MASNNVGVLAESRLLEQIAAIVGKTYAVLGDAAQLADDEALMRIRDLLDAQVPGAIDRNKEKRLSRVSRLTSA